MRATIDNKDRKLWPGQFGNITLILGVEKDAILVPYNAVQLGQQGKFVFVVDKKNKAELHAVKTGLRQEDNIVIESGVESGEKVVTVGVMGLSTGVSLVELPAEAGQGGNSVKSHSGSQNKK